MYINIDLSITVKICTFEIFICFTPIKRISDFLKFGRNCKVDEHHPFYTSAIV